MIRSSGQRPGVTRGAGVADIFISYAQEDRDRIKVLVAALEDEGFTVWWDTRLESGETYDEVIERELDHAGAVIVAWTKTSKKKRWVRSEANRAEKLEKFIPIMLDDNALPLAFELVQTENFIGWKGDLKAECWRRLILKLQAHIGDRSVRTQTGERRAADTKGGGTPLTLLLMAIFIGAFVGAISSGSAVMGGSFAMAGLFFYLFRIADTEVPAHAKAVAGRWLLPAKEGVKVNVAEAFNTLFEAVFGARHLSFKCLWRSAFASTFFLAAILAFALIFVPTVRTAFVNEWGAYLQTLIFTIVVANFIGDYISLFQTITFPCSRPGCSCAGR